MSITSLPQVIEADLMITQLRFDHAFTIVCWKIERSIEIRLEGVFEYSVPGGQTALYDPERDGVRMAPLLSLFNHRVQRLEIRADRDLIVFMADGRTLRCIVPDHGGGWTVHTTDGGLYEPG